MDASVGQLGGLGLLNEVHFRLYSRPGSSRVALAGGTLPPKRPGVNYSSSCQSSNAIAPPLSVSALSNMPLAHQPQSLGCP